LRRTDSSPDYATTDANADGMDSATDTADATTDV
jgi:hypothetical protein